MCDVPFLININMKRFLSNSAASRNLSCFIPAARSFTAVQPRKVVVEEDNFLNTETHHLSNGDGVLLLAGLMCCKQMKEGSLPALVHPFILTFAGSFYCRSGMRSHRNCRSRKRVCSNYARCSVSTVYLSVQQQFKALLR